MAKMDYFDDDLDDLCGQYESFPGHGDIVRRIKKSLYYGKTKASDDEVMECPSLPLTEATVDLFERAIKRTTKTTGSVAKGLEVFDMDYASSVSEKACLSPCSMVVAIIYLERLKKKNPEYLKSASPCDLFLVSMMIASKYLYDNGEDEQVFNDEWAASGSIELAKLNQLEIEFLLAIDWDLHVTPDAFFEKLSVIEMLVTWRQTKNRPKNQGYTYQEVLSLEKLLHWKVVITDHVLRTIALSFLTYSVVLVGVFVASVIATSVHNVMMPTNSLMKAHESLHLNGEVNETIMNVRTNEMKSIGLETSTDECPSLTLSPSVLINVSRNRRRYRNNPSLQQYHCSSIEVR